MVIKIVAGTIMAGLVVGGGTMVAHSPVVAQALHDLHVIPQEQRFSELFFTHQADIPSEARGGDKHRLNITVHNQEKQPTDYHYQILFRAHGSQQQSLTEGDITLAAGQSRHLSPEVQLPNITTPRAYVSVAITYQGIPIGELSSRRQSQSIGYWLRLDARRETTQ